MEPIEVKQSDQEAKVIVNPPPEPQEEQNPEPEQPQQGQNPIEEMNENEENSDVNNEGEDSNVQGGLSKQEEEQKESADIEPENEGEKKQPQQNIANGGGRKCFNKRCPSKKIYKKIRSRVQHAKYRFLCKPCYENYTKNFYCQFCEQIYSNYEGEDEDAKWIGCDGCDRWNHIECQRKYRDKNITDFKDGNMSYYCLTCTQKARGNDTEDYRARSNRVNGPTQEDIITAKRIKNRQLEINKEDRTLVFHKKCENLQNLEGFLQTYNFRLCISEGLIREDIDSLRHTSSIASIKRNPNGEGLSGEERLNKKRVKVD